MLFALEAEDMSAVTIVFDDSDAVPGITAANTETAIITASNIPIAFLFLIFFFFTPFIFSPSLLYYEDSDYDVS
jgi:hypothetical protein